LERRVDCRCGGGGDGELSALPQLILTALFAPFDKLARASKSGITTALKKPRIL